VFVPGSRRYADPGTYLFTPEQWQPRLAEFCQLVRKPSGAAEAIAQVKDELHLALMDLEETLANSFSSDVGAIRLDKEGKLVIPPLSAEDIPAEAKALRDELASMLPFVPIASLLIELDARTNLLACFTHAGGRKSTQSVELKRNILAVLIAGATNLGLTRMSEACGVSYDTPSPAATWSSMEDASCRPTRTSPTFALAAVAVAMAAAETSGRDAALCATIHSCSNVAIRSELWRVPSSCGAAAGSA
jgi:hypothetical protein